ncbi:hypothetical protein D3C86_1443140 [compost metagenome]
MLDQIEQALARLVFGDCQFIDQFEEKVGVKQVKSGHRTIQGAVPVIAGETSILEAEPLSSQHFLTELSPLNLVFELKAVEGTGRKIEPGVMIVSGEPGVVADPKSQLVQRTGRNERDLS